MKSHVYQRYVRVLFILRALVLRIVLIVMDLLTWDATGRTIHGLIAPLVIFQLERGWTELLVMCHAIYSFLRLLSPI